MTKKFLLSLLSFLISVMILISCVQPPTPPTTYSISGKVLFNGSGLSGVKVDLSGANATTNTDANGGYSFAGLSNGDYIVTPSLSGYTFTPATANVTIASANANVADFVASQVIVNTYKISGNVATGTGTGIEGVAISLKASGSEVKNTTTDASGNYEITGVADGTYTLEPSKTDYTFDPTSLEAIVSGADLTGKNFVGGTNYTLSGTITFNSAGLQDVAVAVKNITTNATQNVNTDANGAYSVSVPNGTYEIRPTKTGYVFNYSSKQVVVNYANTTQDFIAYDASLTYTLSGTIKTYGGSTDSFTNLAGVTVDLTGTLTNSTTTDANGAYTFTVNPGNYTVTPTLANTTIIADNYTYDISVTNANVTKNFSAFDNATYPFIYPHDVQGAGHRSPLYGQTVTRMIGVVTAKGGTTPSYFVQSPMYDNDSKTSEGIMVYQPTGTVAVNDWVFVSGLVEEYAYTPAEELSLTEIKTATISAIKSNGTPITPTTLGVGGVTLPTSKICSEAGNADETTFNPDVDGIDFYETIEGMYVQVNDAIVCGSIHTTYGLIHVVGDNGVNATYKSQRGPVAISEGDFNPEKIIVSYKYGGYASNNPTDIIVGDTFQGPLKGIMHYYSTASVSAAYRLISTETLPTINHNNLAKEVTTLTSGASNKLTIASFNIENFYPGDPAVKVEAHAITIVTRLGSPDIVGLIEVQDNNGTGAGVTACDLSMSTLINKIVEKGGPNYSYTQIDPQDGTDGGAPGGNIRQVIMYNPNRVQFTSYGSAIYSTAGTVSNDAGKAKLSHNPVRIDPTNTAFSSSRKPLIAQFTFNGEDIFIVANHLNSKGGDKPLWGRVQPPVLSSETQRLQQATVIKDFINQIKAIQSDANIVMLGDFNDFQFSSPIKGEQKMLINDITGGMKTLVNDLAIGERYSYIYDGNAQVLDHIMLSTNFYDETSPEFDVVHCNAEYLYASTDLAHGQFTDHDPALVRLSFVDIYDPTWATNPASANITPTSFDAKLKVNEDGKVYYALVTNGATAPTVAELKDGTVTAIAKGNITVTGSVEATINFTSLSENTPYDVYFVAEDISNNIMDSVFLLEVSTLLQDNQDPTWVSGYPTIDTLTTTSAVLHVNISDNISTTGTVYYGLYTDGSATPTAVEVKAGTGTGHTGKGGFSAVTMDTVKDINITGLSIGTPYDLYVVAEDNFSTPNLMDTASKLEFTTTDDTTPPTWVIDPTNDTPGTTAITVRAKMNEDGTFYYLVLADGATAPANSAEIKNGGISEIKKGSATATANTECVINITGLTLNTAYDIWVVGEDNKPNLMIDADMKKLDVTTANMTPTLFFSEYIEGNSNEKALEIFNKTGAEVTLTGNYLVLLYANGSATPTGTEAFTGATYKVANNDVFCLRNTSAVLAGITSNSDKISGACNYNGDDALSLAYDTDHSGTYTAGDVIIDTIGQIGLDPGTEWKVGTVSTLNMTLVRKPSIYQGDSNGSNAYDPSVEWDAYPIDTTTYFGSHTVNW